MSFAKVLNQLLDRVCYLVRDLASDAGSSTSTKLQDSNECSPLFDSLFYLQQKPDVANSGVDPWLHFLNQGWRQGRNPHPLFDTSFYLANNPDVARAGVNPLLHYLHYGGREGRNPHPLFDSCFYQEQSNILLQEEQNPLVHYLHSGADAGANPHPLFDGQYYLAKNRDVKINPLVHFVLYGAALGRDPCPFFDSSYYRERYSRFSQFENPLIHYLTDGAAAGYLPSRSFDGDAYLRRRPDVALQKLNPLIHYVTHGRFEDAQGKSRKMRVEIPDFVRTLRARLIFNNQRGDNAVLLKGRCTLNLCVESDNRAKMLLERVGVAEPEINLLWSWFVKLLSPDVILDVGANYGEIALSVRYKTNANIYLFEPNPLLTGTLESSVSSHVNAAQMSVVKSVVAEKVDCVTFYIDRKWSGTSSAIGPITDVWLSYKGEGEETFELLEVSTISIDHLFAQDMVAPDVLLFKLDVEGYETKVILGGINAFCRASRLVGIVECDKNYLVRAGSHPSELIGHLRQLGNVLCMRNGRLEPVSKAEDLPEHTDIIVSSLDELVNHPLPFAFNYFRWV